MTETTFVVELDGRPVKFAVRPTVAVQREGDRAYACAWREAALPTDDRPAPFFRQHLDRVARDRGLWDDDRQARDEFIVERLRTGTKALAKGGIRLSAAKVIALGMYADRRALRALREGRDRLLETTVEGRAEQARFDYLVAACTFRDDTGERYFRDADEMLSRENDPVVFPAGRALAALLHGHDPELDLKHPEATFLLTHGFATAENGRLRLVDDATQRADTAG